MEPFKSILVDIDAAAPEHPALARAVRLAQASGARLTITDVMDIPAYARGYLRPDVEEEMLSLRREQLARVAQGLADVPAEPRLLVGRPATALIQEVLRSKHDLLLRSHAREASADGPEPFSVVDMELLRKCPCPVLLVRQSDADERRAIAGAVNASTVEASERALNVKIVEATLLMAGLAGGVPLLVQAWMPFAERMVRGRSSDEAFAAYVEDVRQRTETDLRRLQESFGDRLSRGQAAHRRGTPEAVIPAFVVAHGVDVVVMGTVARGGIAGLLIGNTAERVLRKLPCSVLAVKPDGFVCPVTLEGV